MQLDISSIIVGALAVLGSYLSNVSLTNRKAREAELKAVEREARQDMRLKSIEKKLDEHNHYAEKIGGVQTCVIKLQKDVEYLRKEHNV